MSDIQPIYHVPRYRVGLIREPDPSWPDAPRMRDAAALAEWLRPMLSDLDREHFVVIACDRKNRPIGLETVAIGTIDQSVLTPRECFKALILLNAAACFLAHNHPSGASEPSHHDDTYTRRMVQAGKLLGIPVIDHLIIAEEGYYSYGDTGKIYSYTEDGA
jgi:DNA repair protein RadC